MKAIRVFTGSAETEEVLRKFLSHVESIHDGVPLVEFEDEYMFKVMTIGRNGPNDHYPGSLAFDDTGGFFEVYEDKVYLTHKAKTCIR